MDSFALKKLFIPGIYIYCNSRPIAKTFATAYWKGGKFPLETVYNDVQRKLYRTLNIGFYENVYFETYKKHL